MTTTPEAMRVCADRLCASANDEATRRAALSRAYYASFHACRLWHSQLPHLGNLNPANVQAGVHGELLDRLTSPNNKNKMENVIASISLSKQLRLLRTYRTNSDYELAMDVEAEWVADAKDTVFGIFKIIKDTPAN